MNDYRIETLMASNDLIADDPLRDDVVIYGVFNDENRLVYVAASKAACEDWIAS